MKNLTRILAALMLFQIGFETARGEVYELRTYTTHEGKLDDLNRRFRDHTVELFRKHGMESVGYWVPVDGPKSKNTLIYVLRHESRKSAKESWKGFIADPGWKKAFQASRKDGPLVKKVDSVFMAATDYSPKDWKGKPGSEAVFELRIYKTGEDRLAKLDTRFRDHTMRIFSRFGMKSVAYWHPLDEPGSKDTLIYILKHSSRQASGESWSSFVKDEEWKKVFQASRKNGPLLRERPESIYMKATDYSAIK